jgi:D-alanyl-D-alanine carboxypeptidase
VRALGVLIVAAAVAVSMCAAPVLAQDGSRPTACTTGRHVAGGDICVARGNALATDIVDAVRTSKKRNPIHSVVFGVWKKGKQITTGAIGDALPGVAATRGDHFRVGNVQESFLTTLLLQLVDDGKVSLDDKLAKYIPTFPECNQVTLEMLARSTSGYGDFVTSDEFSAAFTANPFRQWTPKEIIDIAARQPPVFSPGTSWAFSDTNFVLLGQVLEQVGGASIQRQYERGIYRQVGLDDTVVTPTAQMLDPELHAYSAERGQNEDTTFWSPSWVPNAGDMVSNLADLRKWAPALGEGTLLSRRSHELQTGDENVGLGPLTAQRHYAMGLIVLNDWIVMNPQIDGFTGIVAYLPSKKATVVVSATLAPDAPPGYHAAARVFDDLAEVLTPDHAPSIPVQPRGSSTR